MLSLKISQIKNYLIAKEIFSIFKDRKYFAMYNSMIEMSKLFELGEKNYIEIICGLYVLGFKKDSPINIYM